MTKLGILSLVFKLKERKERGKEKNIPWQTFEISSTLNPRGQGRQEIVGTSR